MDMHEENEKAARRAEMRELCLDNIGRRHKNRKRPRPREMSFNNDDDAAIKIHSEKLKIKVSVSDRKKLIGVFAGLFPEGSVTSHPPAFWKHIVGYDGKFQVRKAKSDYVAAIAKALAVYEYVCSCETSQREHHIKMICVYTGIKPRADSFNLLKQVLLLVIDYRDFKNGTLKIDRKDLSRDALAMGWVIGKNIRSHELVAYRGKHGGGVHRWSRFASKNGNGELDVVRKKIKTELEDHDELVKVRAARQRKEAGDDFEVLPPSKAFIPWVDRCDCKTPEACMSRHVANKYKVEFGDSIWLQFRGKSGDGGVYLVDAAKVSIKGPSGRRTSRYAALWRPIKEAAKAARRERKA